jgi:phosphoglycolate phosphatase
MKENPIDKLVVFDLDGTLNQTDCYAIKAYQLTFQQIGITSISAQDIIAQIGARPEDTVHDLLPGCDESTQAAYFRYLQQNEFEMMKKYGRAFDGTEEMLSKLRTHGYQIAICSNASLLHIEEVLNAIHIRHFIDLIQPLVNGMMKSDILRLLLEKTKPGKSCMVGDRIYDKNAARSNHIPFIGCLYGYNRDEVSDADIAVNAPTEVFDAVVGLLEKAHTSL